MWDRGHWAEYLVEDPAASGGRRKKRDDHTTRRLWAQISTLRFRRVLNSASRGAMAPGLRVAGGVWVWVVCGCLAGFCPALCFVSLPKVDGRGWQAPPTVG